MEQPRTLVVSKQQRDTERHFAYGTSAAAEGSEAVEGGEGCGGGNKGAADDVEGSKRRMVAECCPPAAALR